MAPAHWVHGTPPMDFVPEGIKEKIGDAIGA